MTVQTDDNVAIFVGDGVNTIFQVPFPVVDGIYLQVEVRTVGQGNNVTREQLTYNSDYTVSVLDSGGNVVYPYEGTGRLPLAANQELCVRRALPLVQETSFNNQGAFYAKTIEKTFDQHMMIMQQINETVSRTLQYAVGSRGHITFPEASPGKGVKFNPFGALVLTDYDPDKQVTICAELAREVAAYRDDVIHMKQAIDSLYARMLLMGSVGSIQAFAMEETPSGWLACDGSAISRAIYADLYAIVGNKFGDGDGVSTFNIPDLRGEFIRGYDAGRGVDVGRVFGSFQADELKSHTHNYQASNGGAYDHGDQYLVNVYNNMVSKVTDASGGSETRPRNVAFLYCIKY